MLVALATLATSTAGCLGEGKPRVVVVAPPKQAPPHPAGLRAAAREVDITPPPGLPSYGHSSNGVSSVCGYWLRLKARIIALDDGQGKRVVMVQLDLGASSALLHRRIAEALRKQHVGPPNLVMSATHTHGGPGGFFGHRFYNRFVGAAAVYEPRFVDWLTTRIAAGAKEALDDLAPAQLAITQVDVSKAASFNRSRPAWARNFDATGAPRPADAVDRKLTMIRIDVEKEGKVVPLAAWSIFGVHGTSMPASYELHHGDVHGLASRLIRDRVNAKCGTSAFVAAMANGAEGDVSPGPDASAYDEQGKGLTQRVATHIADAAMKAFGDCPTGATIEAAARNTKLDYAYREVSLRGAGTTRGRLCPTAILGSPQLGGSEDGRGPLYGAFGMYEGAKREPGGCDAFKKKIGGDLQDLIVDTDEFPDVVPFQVVQFGEDFVLATVPGEPTTEVGRAITTRLLAPSKKDEPPRFKRAAVLGLTNGYATYFTMPDEFLAQHYEGGATLYGPYQGLLAAEELQDLARALGHSRAVRFRAKRTFMPGEKTERFPKESCGSTWKRGDTDAEEATFEWQGIHEDQLCELPRVEVHCQGKRVASDEGSALEVRRSGADSWEAKWNRQPASNGECRIIVNADASTGGSSLKSNPFPASAP